MFRPHFVIYYIPGESFLIGNGKLAIDSTLIIYYADISECRESEAGKDAARRIINYTGSTRRIFVSYSILWANFIDFPDYDLDIRGAICRTFLFRSL